MRMMKNKYNHFEEHTPPSLAIMLYSGSKRKKERKKRKKNISADVAGTPNPFMTEFLVRRRRKSENENENENENGTVLGIFSFV